MSVDISFDFDAGTPAQTQGGNGGGHSFDPEKYKQMDELKKNVIGLGKQILIGVPSQIYDLGMQERDDYEEEWTGSAEQENKLENYEGAHKGTGTSGKSRGKTCLIYPQKPVRQITLAVEFFEKMIDLGQFFRKEDAPAEEKPYRMILGGQWFRTVEGKRVDIIAKPFNMVHTNLNRDKKDCDEPLWSFAKNNGLYKMAEAAGVLNEDGSFTTADVAKLLGKPISFEVNLEENKWTKDGKEFSRLRENVKIQGALSARDKSFFDSDIAPMIKDHLDMFGGINMHKANKPEHVKQIKSIVKKTMGLAMDFKGSVLEKELNGSVTTDSSGSSSSGNGSANASSNAPAKQAPAAQKPVNNEPEIDFDDK